tara:strand:+ start:760 stop:987 length:228 start_codon:yes stop_codon:yes gene_type:complete
MLEEEATDTLHEMVLDPDFIEEQVDRLLAWEIFVRHVKGIDQENITPSELCDRIGVHKWYINHLLEDIKLRFYAK